MLTPVGMIASVGGRQLLGLALKWSEPQVPRVAPKVCIARFAYHMLTVRWHLGCEKQHELQHRVAPKVD